MPYPVPPPEPPAIVNYQPSEQETAEAIASSLANPQALAAATAPETLADEPFPAATSAALLGPAMEVKSPLQPVKRVPTPVEKAPQTRLPDRAHSEPKDTPEKSKQLPAFESSPQKEGGNASPPPSLSIAVDWFLKAGAAATSAEPENTTDGATRDVYPATEVATNDRTNSSPTEPIESGAGNIAEGKTRDVYPTTEVATNTRPNQQLQAAIQLLAPVAARQEASGEEIIIPEETQAPAPSNRQPQPEEESSGQELIIPEETQAPAPNKPPGKSPPEAIPGGNPTIPAITPADVIELKADRQEFNNDRQVATGEGNVVMRARGATLDAEWVQVNLLTQMAVAEGDAIYAKGQQILRGDRIEYDIVQNRGGVQQAKGQIFTPSSGEDFSPTLPTDVTATALQQQNLIDRLRAGEPPKRVSPTGAINVGIGAGGGIGIPQTGGTVNRVRFESEQLNFTAAGWEGTNVRITNDPFSPPELELRADRATFRSLSPEKDEIVAKRARLVFDNRISIPLLRERVIIDRSDRDPSLVRFGYDRDDRGGVYAETTVVPLAGRQGPVQFNLIPQYYIQRSLEEGTSNLSRLFGLKAKFAANPTPTTSIVGSALLTNFDFNDEDENLRASLRVRQMLANHAVSGEYSYRDRLFNGSLGYQTVHQSVGLVMSSPAIRLGPTGINLSYQASAQNINADSDRVELLEPMRENNRINLNRYQASAALSRGFLLWQGEALPRTPTQGLRYTPAPVVPYIRLFGGVTGTATAYSSDDTQNSLTGSIGIQGQFGHFSRRWLDYTGFNVSLSRVWQDGESPFLFDRIADSKVLSAGFTQQIYGPFRFGIQTSINLDTGETIGTDYTVEYSRRTYGLSLRYNPQRQVGSLSLQINDFNWAGGGQPFTRSEVRSVEGGVQRSID